MSAFALELGESRFLLQLAPGCAELLADVFPSATETTGGAPGHRVSVHASDGSFEARWRSAEHDRDEALALPSAGAAMLAVQEAVERRVIADASELLALHGGAVATAAGGCLVLGDSGSGKSSTTFQLVELGATFFCEEIALCRYGDWRIHPYPQTLSLSTSLLDEWCAEFELRGRRRDLMPPVVRYTPRELPAGDALGPAVERIVLPRYRANHPTAVTRLAPEEALTEVLGYCFPPNADAETQFDRMIALVERAEILRFVYSGAGEARAALAELFEL